MTHRPAERVARGMSNPLGGFGGNIEVGMFLLNLRQPLVEDALLVGRYTSSLIDRGHAASDHLGPDGLSGLYRVAAALGVSQLDAGLILDGPDTSIIGLLTGGRFGDEVIRSGNELVLRSRRKDVRIGMLRLRLSERDRLRTAPDRYR